jgi:hypothetical protein
VYCCGRTTTVTIYRLDHVPMYQPRRGDHDRGARSSSTALEACRVNHGCDELSVGADGVGRDGIALRYS